MNQDDLYEEILKRRTHYSGKYLSLEELTVQLPNGVIGKREIVHVQDAVAIFPIDKDEKVYLVRQHRPAIGETILEIPAGLVDPGETLEEAAKRECREEIGYTPEKLTKLLTYAHAEGYSTGRITLYLGQDLKASSAFSQDETEYLQNVTLPFDDLLEKVQKNQIKDSKTIISTLYWQKIHQT